MLTSRIRFRSCEDHVTSKIRPTWETPWWSRSFVPLWKLRFLHFPTLSGTETGEVCQDVFGVCPDYQVCSHELLSVSHSDGETDQGESPCELNVNPSPTDDDVRDVEEKDVDEVNHEGSGKMAELPVPTGSLDPNVRVPQVIEEVIHR